MSLSQTNRSLPIQHCILDRALIIPTPIYKILDVFGGARRRTPLPIIGATAGTGGAAGPVRGALADFGQRTREIGGGAGLLSGEMQFEIYFLATCFKIEKM